jgi:hypothetical protein
MATDRLSRVQDNLYNPPGDGDGREQSTGPFPGLAGASAELVTIGGVIAAAALARLIEHPPNFAPIGAMALFAGAHIRNRALALIVPLAAMALSDLFLPRDAWQMHVTVYATFCATVGLGMLLRRCHASLQVRDAALPSPSALSRAIKGLASALWIGSFALLASLLFFAVTNFVCWQVYPIYAKTPAGLLHCYQMAIPFFSHTVAGDLFYSLVLFGGYALLVKIAAALRPRFAPEPAK